jgi:hypothetical protein
MNKNQFRLFLFSSVIFAILALVVSFWFPSQNVDVVNDYIIELEMASPEQYFSDMLLLVIGVLVAVAVVASYAGLLFFKSWARHLYVASFVLALPTYFMGGLFVTSGIEDLLYDLSMLISGAVVALIYFSPVKEYFVDTKI